LSKNVKTRKIAIILETARIIAKSSKFQSKKLLLGVQHGKLLVSNYIEKTIAQN